MAPGEDAFDSSPKASSSQEHGRTSSTSRADRSEPPKRLRYWLIDMINSGKILGLQWLDSTHTIFRIPWKHAGKNNWKEEDCMIFQAWAEHRGKFKPGDKIEAATWKTRLRCALNKLPDIKELKEQSYLEGNEPFRVYQLLPEPEKAQEQEIYPRNMWGKESPPSRYNTSPNQFHASTGRSGSVDYGYQPPQQQALPKLRYSPSLTTASQNLLPSPGHPLTTTPPMIPTSEFRQLNVDERYRATMQNGFLTNKINFAPTDPNTGGPYIMRTHSETYDPYSPGTPGHQNVMLSQMGNVSPGSGGSPISPGAHLMDMDANACNQPPVMDFPPQDVPNELPFPDIPPQLYEMEIYVHYRGHTVIAEHVTNKQGCRIHFGDTSLQLIAMATHELPSIVFGSDSLRQIELVNCERYALSEQQAQLTKKVLGNIKRGLIIQYEDHCFYAKRLCQSRVFITGPETTDDTPEKLEREAKVKVFDNRKFWAQLQRYVSEGRLKTPELELRASFGQSWSIKTPIEKNLVTVSMIPRAARYVLQKMREQHGPMISLNDSLISDCGPDNYDQLAEEATRQSVQGVDDFVQQMVHQNPDFITSVRPMVEAQVISSHPPVTSGPANVCIPTNGFFQRNTFRPAPMVPLTSSNDVEMNGYYNS